MEDNKPAKMSYKMPKNKTYVFKTTYHDYLSINATMRITGLEPDEFFTKAALGIPIEFYPGVYESYRLAIELKKLRLRLDEEKEHTEILEECIALLEKYDLILEECKKNQQ